jgi:hypothetical protein
MAALVCENDPPTATTDASVTPPRGLAISRSLNTELPGSASVIV